MRSRGSWTRVPVISVEMGPKLVGGDISNLPSDDFFVPAVRPAEVLMGSANTKLTDSLSSDLSGK